MHTAASRARLSAEGADVSSASLQCALREKGWCGHPSIHSQGGCALGKRSEGAGNTAVGRFKGPIVGRAPLLVCRLGQEGRHPSVLPRQLLC